MPGIFSRLLVLALFSGVLCAEPLRVAVASNFLLPAEELARRFRDQGGGELTLSVGSTGKLYAQIVNGAPYGVFLAANAREPERLEARGQAVRGSRFTYALGRLVLWSPDDKGPIPDAALLRRGAFERLAAANPRTAPYGAAAMQALRALGLDPDDLGRRLVRGENVSQAFQFAATGNAEVALVALAQVRNPGRQAAGRYWLVPAELHEPIAQQAVLLASAAEDRRAAAFLGYLRSPAARALLADFGYGTD